MNQIQNFLRLLFYVWFAVVFVLTPIIAIFFDEYIPQFVLMWLLFIFVKLQEIFQTISALLAVANNITLTKEEDGNK